MKSLKIVYYLILLCCSNVYAQDNEVFTIVEKMPEFKGDLETAKQNVVNQISCLNNGETYYFKLLIEKDGSVSNAQYLNGNTSLTPDCKNTIDKAFKTMSKWNAGEQAGKPVRVYYNVNIKKNNNYKSTTTLKTAETLTNPSVPKTNPKIQSIDSIVKGYVLIDTTSARIIYGSFNGVERINEMPQKKNCNCNCNTKYDDKNLAIMKCTYPSGKIKSITNYVDGEPKGLFLSYYENGIIQRQESDYRNIHNHTIVAFFEDGSLELISKAKNDEFESKAYYKTGKLKISRKGNNAKKNSVERSFYENGQLGIQKEIINGEQEGEQICYFEDGSIQYKVNYKNGKKEGGFVEYHKNGKLYVKANYSNGKIVGEQEKYDNEGVLIKK